MTFPFSRQEWFDLVLLKSVSARPLACVSVVFQRRRRRIDVGALLSAWTCLVAPVPPKSVLHRVGSSEKALAHLETLSAERRCDKWIMDCGVEVRRSPAPLRRLRTHDSNNVSHGRGPPWLLSASLSCYPEVAGRSAASLTRPSVRLSRRLRGRRRCVGSGKLCLFVVRENSLIHRECNYQREYFA